VTYRGDKPIIKNKTAIVITDIALISANLTMLNKISSILSIVSFVISISTLGGAYAGYRYITSPQFEKMMMDKVMEKVSGMMPKVLDGAIPSTTGKSIPFTVK
tara:strand:- start:481 stop:789 length:309 start_codon:yes stop_codon:yes gene_type:complete